MQLDTSSNQPVIVPMLMVSRTRSLRLLYTYYLNQLGCQVLAVEEVPHALAALQNDGHFKAVFITMLFPYEEELEFIREAKQCFPQMPIVVISQVHHDMLPIIEEIYTHSSEFMYIPRFKADFEQVLSQLELI